MRVIDEQYLKTPVYGSRSMRNHLRRLGHKKINRKRVQRLMRLMGLEAIYPKPVPFRVMALGRRGSLSVELLSPSQCHNSGHH
jgi:hypothetical protein